MHFSKLTMISISLAGLTACGGSVNSPNETYYEFQNTGPVTSQLTGRAFGYSDAVRIVVGDGPAAGTLQHDTGAITLQSPGGSLSDADGVDGNGDLFDDNNTSNAQTIATLGDNAYTGTYNFVRPFSQSFLGQTFGLGAVGFVGMATNATDIPVTGTATFAGEAHGSTQTTGNWVAAPATISTNFATGTVDVLTANTAGGVTEGISVTGMTIAGNEFSGGSFSITHNNAVVDGTSFGTLANGMFYGYDTGTGGPDEVGVLLSHAGADASGALTILAD